MKTPYIIDEQHEEQEIQSRFEELVAACREIYPLQEEQQELLRAFQLAKAAHAGTRRRSGEPYIFHPLAVALIAVKEVGLGPIAVVSALLHDVVEDTDVSLDQLRTIFGDRVATIVDGLTKISDATVLCDTDSKQAENYRKILLSMCDDAYVFFLKICDRLHNMRTLESMSPEKQLAISSETQYLYIPLAHRLGLYAIKTELEELVMYYKNRKTYFEISEKIKQSSDIEQQLRTSFVPAVQALLDKEGLNYTLKTRQKSVYSCWRKMERKGIQFEEIFDLYAMRIILDVPPEREKEECFKVCSIIGSHFPTEPTRFRDWITVPKTNGYESLQITVMSPIGQWVEIQIRSTRMDMVAEKGMAAHFLYKESHPGENTQLSPVEEWLQQIRSTLESTEKSALDLVEEFKEALHTKEIYLFTPKGDMITLPAKSSVLDFAFAIHSDLGLHCIGAKVNGRVEAVGYTLRAGEQVQILTSRKTQPSDQWIEIAHTSRARDAIKDFLREKRKAYQQEGEQRLLKMFDKQHIHYNAQSIGVLKKELGFVSDIDLFYDVATGVIDEHTIAKCFSNGKKIENQDSGKLYFMGPYQDLFNLTDTKIYLPNDRKKGTESGCNGSENHQSQLLDADSEQYPREIATCCNPVQGDRVVGIVNGEKITVHRTNCKIANDEMACHENRIVRVRWRRGETVSFLSGIAFTAIDQQGLLQELTRIISQQMELNMRALTMESVDGVVRGMVVLFVHNLENLNTLIKNLNEINGIQEVRRI